MDTRRARFLASAARTLLVAVGVLVILLGLLLSAPPAAPTSSPASGTATSDPLEATPEAPEPVVLPAAFLAHERNRIQAHLAEVEYSLRARDVSHLPAPTQEARARHLDRLREYRLRGEFPLNVEQPGRPVPVFRDHRGLLCAVGYLLARDGEGNLVDRIASTRNLARIPELADEPALVAWLEGAGLTVEEAARIQPQYNGWPGWPEPESTSGLSRTYVAASVASGVAATFISGWSLAGMGSESPPTQAPALGTLAGSATLLLGATHLGDEDRATRRVALANLAVGVLTVGASIHAHRQIQLRIQPHLSRSEPRGEGESTAVGVRGSIRF
jgi:hypothetical protein